MNGPSTFQREINRALAGLIGKGVFVFIDDVIIYSRTLEEHTRTYRKVIERLIEYNFKMKIDKCEFLKKKISYLGHVLSANGLEACPKKVEAVMNFPIPKDQKNIREFLGLCVYYSKFIKDFAKITKPITELLMKDKEFIWEEKQHEAFEKLKKNNLTQKCPAYGPSTYISGLHSEIPNNNRCQWSSLRSNTLARTYRTR